MGIVMGADTATIPSLRQAPDVSCNFMRTLQIFIILLFFGFSCLPIKVMAQDICEEVLFHVDNKDNDTSKVVYVRGATFDTIAILVHGYVKDRITNYPIANASIIISHQQNKDSLITDKNGEFNYWTMPSKGYWNVKISRYKYKCLVINDVVHYGGQWIYFKLNRIKE